MKIFLSHSSRDKAFVRRLSNDLKAHKFDTWLDEDEVPFGGNFSEHIQQALERSDVLIAFLSEASVVSKWVSAEWQVKLIDQMNKKRVTIIPLLIQDCAVPPFLTTYRYADFRSKANYETNLSLLLRHLNYVRTELGGEKDIPRRSSSTVSEYTKDFLDALEKEYLSMPIQTYSAHPLAEADSAVWQESPARHVSALRRDQNDL